MKPCFSLLCLILLVASHTQAQNNPSPDERAIVSAGKEVRFTVLTPGLIRMEWDSTGAFTNNASFVIVNRRLPVPSFKQSTKGGWLSISTSTLELRYKLGAGKFNADNLTVRYLAAGKTGFNWKPGMVQKANLKGTARTLDGYDGDTYHNGNKLQLEDGLLARDGWHLLDDSRSFLFDKSDWPWVEERKNAGIDWYFMGYGNQYKTALADYIKVAGKVPLPPRYTFGYWWSRYWAYSDNELRDLVRNFNRFQVPLDVLVIDMDWHTTDSVGAPRDEFGQSKWWTGWTWNKGLFTHPEKFLQWTNERHLKTTLNLHPASGIAPFEEQYAAFAQKMNFDTSARRNIPYIGSDKQFMQTLFDVVLKPMEQQGVDFWWLDWQQWGEDKKIKGLSNTWWLNYMFFTAMERSRKERPMLYHRWGGLGNHRYQIGFSGDAYVTWKSLEYQPYFTNAASNVLYGYWSHDIGGHQIPKNFTGLDPELYTRWMQYGALSPVFRTHSMKNALLNKEIWNFRGEYFDGQYDAIKLRYALAPYIYTMARKTYETGISLCRPMYYDYPTNQEAYDLDRQYQFGDDILVAPIGAPSVDGRSTVKVWLPSGNDWYEWHTGTRLKGGQVLERSFAIDEYPIYVKAGTVLPMYLDNVQHLDENPDTLRIGIFPGAAGQTKIYEDAGNDQQYDTHYAQTTVSTAIKADSSLTLTIEPRQGQYPGMKPTRTYQLTLYGAQMPEQVLLNGQAVNWNNSGNSVSWRYNGREMSVNIQLPSLPADQQTIVTVQYASGKYADINGLPQLFKRLSKATTALKFKNAGLVLPRAWARTEETNLLLEYEPQNFQSLVNSFREQYAHMPELIRTVKLDAAIEEWYLKSLGLR
ncbi:MAG: glycoside hydrolase family 31 protein [Candidatus Pseudobacter hemicellulosilyticus]|uniref:Glycoside hydrolase family 31 protein n=1 Tax=Candidatus Pseudobacter hemicellulosilyticus TaxID=3121375 RepID=A0AAJ5WX81_9BACT|nr:MAG: glycoside hydrolase family 31 protein [Pseudobacter sp.]